MKITICLNTENASFEDDFKHEMNRMVDSLCDILPELEPTSICRKSLRDANGNPCGYIEISDEEVNS